jgi:TonB family protein
LFLILLAVGGGLVPSRLAAQSVLCVEHHGKAAVVRQIRNGFLYVEENGKLVRAEKDRCGLIKTEEYYPAFVSVGKVEVRTSGLLLHNSANEINNDFMFRGEFKSPYRLHNVFLVLEMETQRVGAAIFYQEIGELEPGVTRPLALRVPMHEAIGSGKYKMHLFSDGAELLHSQLPPAYREEQLDRMVAKRIKGVVNAEPRPFFGPQPDYPESLRHDPKKGSVLVGFRILGNGVVADPEIKSATDPAFGQVALDCIRLWRFLPRMRDGRPQEMTVTMPFEFALPADGEKPGPG